MSVLKATHVISMPSHAEMFSWSSLRLVSSGCLTGSEPQQKRSDAQTLMHGRVASLLSTGALQNAKLSGMTLCES